MGKIEEIAVKIKAYNFETSEERYLEVISDLMDSVSYMIDSVNYPVYVGGQSSNDSTGTGGG